MTAGNGLAATDNTTGSDDPQVTIEPRVTVQIGPLEILGIAVHGHPRKFKDELRAIAKELRQTATADTELDLTRKAAALQLGTVIECLQYDEDLRETNDLQPLFQYFLALHDLCAGGKPPLLCDVTRPDDVKTKPKITSTHLAQGVLIVAYMALERVKGKPAKAREWLDKELRDRKLHELVCGTDIHRWHNRYTAGRLAPTAVKTIRDYEAELLSLQDGAEAQAFARKCLDVVRDLGLERLKLHQNKC